MASYSFLSTWLLDSPCEPVWETLYDQARWPEWWRGVERVEEVRRGDDGDIGTVARMTWRSLLPYRVRFDVTMKRIECPHLFEGEAVGDLTGVGRWRLYEQDGVTAVLYEWNVVTTKTWMNLVAPAARSVFEWNHDWVMARGGEGMARRLGCRLLASG